MAVPQEPPPGTVPVTDHRTPPAGVLPRRIQTWVMAGLAGVILLIILLAGEPRPPETPAAASRPAPVNADRVREYQDRLRAMEARAALDAAAAVPPSPPVRVEAGGGPRAEDPTVAERRRRDYDSLFASNVVLSRRADDARPRDSASASAAPVVDGMPAVPSLDAVADAVVRASTRQAALPIPASPLPASAPTDAAAGDRGRVWRPEDTPPIEAAGPLHRLLEGTFIDAVLTNRLDGSDAAPVVSLVTQPVFSHAGHVIVIPAGARVIGETRPIRSVGESRLAVAFHRLVMPDGRTYGLDGVRGLNPRGDAGLRDQVNAHYWATFGAAGAVGLISGLSQWLGTAGLSDGDGGQTIVLGGAVASSTAQTSQQVMSRFLNRLPTVTIREGHRLKVYLARDLDLPAYEAAGLAATGKEQR